MCFCLLKTGSIQIEQEVKFFRREEDNGSVSEEYINVSEDNSNQEADMYHHSKKLAGNKYKPVSNTDIILHVDKLLDYKNLTVNDFILRMHDKPQQIYVTIREHDGLNWYSMRKIKYIDGN